MFKVGDKVTINFDEVLKKKTTDEAIECARLNIDKVFIIKRIPNNKLVELNEEVKPYSNYIHRDFITSIRKERKDKLYNINKNNEKG